MVPAEPKNLPLPYPDSGERSRAAAPGSPSPPVEQEGWTQTGQGWHPRDIGHSRVTNGAAEITLHCSSSLTVTPLRGRTLGLSPGIRYLIRKCSMETPRAGSNFIASRLSSPQERCMSCSDKQSEGWVGCGAMPWTPAGLCL